MTNKMGRGNLAQGVAHQHFSCCFGIVDIVDQQEKAIELQFGDTDTFLGAATDRRYGRLEFYTWVQRCLYNLLKRIFFERTKYQTSDLIILLQKI